jgi:2-iminobutanoate/2-iminopropanoate deaminase
MKKIISSAGDQLGYPFCMVAEAKGKFVFVSGQGHIDLQTGKVQDGSLEDKMRLTFENVKTHLENAGAKMDDVVNCRVYLAELSKENFALLSKVFNDYFKKQSVTRTTIGCKLNGIDFEVDCVACID